MWLQRFQHVLVTFFYTVKPRLPPGFYFVWNKLLYEVYAVRHRHPPTVFFVPMYLNSDFYKRLSHQLKYT